MKTHKNCRGKFSMRTREQFSFANVKMREFPRFSSSSISFWFMHVIKVLSWKHLNTCFCLHLRTNHISLSRLSHCILQCGIIHLLDVYRFFFFRKIVLEKLSQWDGKIKKILSLDAFKNACRSCCENMIFSLSLLFTFHIYISYSLIHFHTCLIYAHMHSFIFHACCCAQCAMLACIC
jgi:hypothetical protein